MHLQMSEVLKYVVMIPYALVLVLVAIYGIHCYQLLYLHIRNKKNVAVPQGRFDDLPIVTVQLPLYNEQYVVERAIDAACRIDYPREKLEIQVLDDSTDDTAEVAKGCIETWRGRGVDIKLIHRQERVGYKAGALQEGTLAARGDYVAIFDADFVANPSFLHETIHYFTNPEIGMVQSRWGHLNKDTSLLTMSQAILIDGHFAIEHSARSSSGMFINFNGSAGIWRKSCVLDAGGWSQDTLSEDLDLSYRAQLKGWKFVYVPDLVCPAELPVDMQAFKTQQHRWTKGTIQAAIKLLPRIFKSKEPWKVKCEALFHLTSRTVSVYVAAMSVLMLPVLLDRFTSTPGPDDLGTINVWTRIVLIDVPVFTVATLSGLSMYIFSQKELYNSWVDKLKYVPVLMGIGIGISVINAQAVMEAIFDKQNVFVRTPKYGDRSRREARSSLEATKPRSLLPILEIALGCYVAVVFLVALLTGHWVSSLFLFIFCFGYLYVGIMSLVEDCRGRPAPKRAGNG